jgi:hypothetical protein
MIILSEDLRFRIHDLGFPPQSACLPNHKSEIINPKLFLIQRGRKLFDLFGPLEIGVFDAAIKGALVAFGFAAAQMGFADMRSHQLAACGDFEPLGGRFVSFNLWHAIYSMFNDLDLTINGRG